MGQRTFTLVPTTTSAPVVTHRPMTSKQVKAAHAAKNKAPKVSKSEQRRIEREILENHRKEYERDRAREKARLQREKKKLKQEQEKEAKRKKGVPGKVRASQPVINGFLRPKKRTRDGEEKTADSRETSIGEPEANDGQDARSRLSTAKRAIGQGEVLREDSVEEPDPFAEEPGPFDNGRREGSIEEVGAKQTESRSPIPVPVKQQEEKAPVLEVEPPRHTAEDAASHNGHKGQAEVEVVYESDEEDYGDFPSVSQLPSTQAITRSLPKPGELGQRFGFQPQPSQSNTARVSAIKSRFPCDSPLAKKAKLWSPAGPSFTSDHDVKTFTPKRSIFSSTRHGVPSVRNGDPETKDVSKTMPPPAFIPKRKEVMPAPAAPKLVTPAAMAPPAFIPKRMEAVPKPAAPTIMAPPAFKPGKRLAETSRTTMPPPAFKPGKRPLETAHPNRPSYTPRRKQSQPQPQPPTGTQLFLLNHLDDFLPSPTQQMREIVEDTITDIGDMPSNTQVARELSIERVACTPSPPPPSVKASPARPEVAEEDFSLLDLPSNTQIALELQTDRISCTPSPPPKAKSPQVKIEKITTKTSTPSISRVGSAPINNSKSTKGVPPTKRCRSEPDPTLPPPRARPQVFDDLSFISTQDLMLSSQDFREIDSPCKSETSKAPAPAKRPKPKPRKRFFQTQSQTVDDIEDNDEIPSPKRPKPCLKLSQQPHTPSARPSTLSTVSLNTTSQSTAPRSPPRFKPFKPPSLVARTYESSQLEWGKENVPPASQPESSFQGSPPNFQEYIQQPMECWSTQEKYHFEGICDEGMDEMMYGEEMM